MQKNNKINNIANKIRKYPYYLIFSVMILSVLGTGVIGSAAPDMLYRQTAGMIAGIILMFCLSWVDYHSILAAGWFIYAGAVAFLLLVEMFGSVSGGSKRWIDIGIIRFQPSELTKLLLILFFGWYLIKNKDNINRPLFLSVNTALAGLPVLLILKQPDLSTGIIVIWIFLCMMFLAGLSYKVIGTAIAAGVPLSALLMYLITRPGQNIINEYQYRRIMAWLSPESWSQDAYQQRNSTMAIASGGMFGKGLNNSTPLSVKNGGYIPEEHTDFVMAVVGEELGFAGSILLILLLLCIILSCLWIGYRAKDRSGRIICGGMAGWIAGQSFVNICVASSWMPNTGLTLPFISYGLTSLLCLFIGIGIVLNIAVQGTGRKLWQVD